MYIRRIITKSGNQGVPGEINKLGAIIERRKIGKCERSDLLAFMSCDKRIRFVRMEFDAINPILSRNRIGLGK